MNVPHCFGVQKEKNGQKRIKKTHSKKKRVPSDLMEKRNKNSTTLRTSLHLFEELLYNKKTPPPNLLPPPPKKSIFSLFSSIFLVILRKPQTRSTTEGTSLLLRSCWGDWADWHIQRI